MVAVRTNHVGQDFNLKVWARGLHVKDSDREEILKVFAYCRDHMPETLAEEEKLTRRAAEIVGILLTLHMDLDTYKSAILYPHLEEHFFTLEEANRDFGPRISRILHGVKDMEAINFMHNLSSGAMVSNEQVDTIRRMLIAMIEDVRAVVIKLSERIAVLRESKNMDEEVKVLLAKESANIYAPLANRLGIGQLKWELEDLSFRYLQPDTYKQIARLLDEKRIDRENYINNFVAELSQALKRAGIEASVYGRPKHIYSIWRKMQKKHLAFSQLYDVRAVRVIVKHVRDCYAALGIVHTRYHLIQREFDDYIANPKPNGYQSIHTVVLGPEGKAVEIQIRSESMHKNAELGVAAHWKYKEGDTPGINSEYEKRIAWLRKILSWQENMMETGAIVEDFKNQVFEDRVYVFTPKGDVVDLPAGATPLDMAYQIHTALGHRCTGAKVGGSIVPFTYKLQTGDQVEIITQKEENPSRDWMNPAYGYIATSKARNKIAAWFKKQDRDKNIEEGRALLQKTMDQHGIKLERGEIPGLLDEVLNKYNARDHKDIYAKLGSGDIRINQLMNFLEEKFKEKYEEPDNTEELQKTIEQNQQQWLNSARQAKGKSQVMVNGVGNLLTHMARCCHPVRGDDIVGFITHSGITIHRRGCDQLKHMAQKSPERLVEAEWGENYSQGYAVTIVIEANDRSGLLRDITTIIANERINVLGVSSSSNTKMQLAKIVIRMEVYNINDLTRTLSRLNQMPDVLSARRE